MLGKQDPEPEIPENSGWAAAKEMDMIPVESVKTETVKETVYSHDQDHYRMKINMAINEAGIVLWEYDIQERIFSSRDAQSLVYMPMQYDDYFKLVHPEDVANAQTLLQDIIGEREFRNRIEFRLLMPNGEYRWSLIQGSVSERNEHGTPTKIMGVRRDINHEKKLTRQLIELKEEAEKSNKLKSAYLANMSHEIRTPLNAIVGFSNLMMYTDDPAEKEEYNRIIQTNNELLLQLISDILDLSKIEAGFLVFNYTQTDISAVFYQVEQLFGNRTKPGVELKLNVPFKQCIISTDRNRITQVLSNFLTNAYKFTNAGTIELGYEKTESGVKIYVADTGIGMTQEQCDKVFDRFSKFGKDVVGTGLGMAICDTIVKTFGGNIGVNSKIGEGSTFWAEIPCEPLINDHVTDAGAEALLNCDNSNVAKGISENKKSDNSDNQVDASQKYDVLIAEDHDSNYLLISKILEKECSLRRACDGVECIEQFVAKKPDIIFMDIQMPVMDGYQATSAIREIDQTLPIVAVTANAFDSDKEKALAAGCTDYITKPVNRRLLRETLLKYCCQTGGDRC
ncbi:MAG: response regulator [Bacteroidales bacterium]